MSSPKRIAIIGAGFTGLTAAYKLASFGNIVEVFEKDDKPGGLAIGIKLPRFSWSIEKHYHHLFTNDTAIRDLLTQVGLAQKLIFPPSKTSMYFNDMVFPFNTPKDFLSFPPLSILDRLRLAYVSAYLKGLPKSVALKLENRRAVDWIAKAYGKTVTDIVWLPLLKGKFGKYVKDVNMAWLWARIKKRTFKLGYIEGGFQTLAEILVEEIKKLGGKIHFNATFNEKDRDKFDYCIVTTPTVGFLKIFPHLPSDYTKNLSSIPHLHALNLLMVGKNKFFSDNTYWLNINDRKFPFIAVVEHTNFIDPEHYGGQHLVYVGNYLPPSHPYLKMTKDELVALYLPFLKKINPKFDFEDSSLHFELFFGPYAQPVFPLGYSAKIPRFATPYKNVFLANMDMVYPWDRGTNYAVEIGTKVAEYVHHIS